MLEAQTNAAELAVVRQQILKAWEDAPSLGDDDDAFGLKYFELLTLVEKNLVAAAYDTDADKLAAKGILAEDSPSDWCDFKNQPFQKALKEM